jgi:hypothetical protein
MVEKNLKKMRDLANDPKFKASSFLHRPQLNVKK